MKKAGWRELDASANEALTRFFDRDGGWAQVDARMPFQELLEAEDDGEDEKAGDYEFRQRMIGVKAFFRFLRTHGVHPAAMLKQMAAAGRACHEEPFSTMTMGEIGMLFGETKAAHSWRCKILSREIELSGQRGSKLPGQKTKEASETYRKIRKGNTNRKGGKKQSRARQQSFLRKLHVPVTHDKKTNNEHEHEN